VPETLATSGASAWFSCARELVLALLPAKLTVRVAR
jgi:hypothetical protein